MKIRAHHILCVQNYIGYGYSEDFKVHMDEIVKKLRDDPRIEITEGCDDICAACPYNENGQCSSLDKVKLMDEKTADALGLKCGDRISWNTASDMASKQIFETQLFVKICGSCQWYDICLKQVGQRAKGS